MKLAAVFLAMPISHALAQDEQVPTPSMMDPCDERVVDFVAANAAPMGCPEGLPGTWTECMPECASGLQAALSNLDCCTPNYLNEQFANGSDIDYARMAFPNVISVCELDIAGVKGCATDQCDLDVIEFQMSMMPNVSTCQQDMMPGSWNMCDETCASALQMAVTSLSCCAVDFLETFVGLNEQEYAVGAFPNVISQCDLDVSGLKGCAVDECDLRVIEYQNTAMPDLSTCESSAMPGDWASCDSKCSEALQAVATELGCCAVDFLETFVGLNEQAYATMAYPNVVEQCELDVSGLKGCAVDECDLQVIEFQSAELRDVSSCPTEQMPGNWEACDDACAATLQDAIDTLDCCAVDFLETFVGLNEQDYATRAFPNVVDVCALNVTSLADAECLPEGDECVETIAAFETPIDVTNTTCEIAVMPGNWTTCDEGCAASIQATVDDLGCCTIDFLELFVGGDAREYAAAAFDHVMDLCDIDLSNIEGACVPDEGTASTEGGSDGPSSAASLALTWASSVGVLFLLGGN